MTGSPRDTAVPTGPGLPGHLRALGTTGVLASPLTLGASSLGAGSGPGDDREGSAVDLATAMLRSPNALIDTSNNYAGGRSESVLGLALARTGFASRGSIVTKADHDPETRRLDRDRVRRSFDESCERLGVDRLGLFHLHDPYSVTFDAALARGGAVEGMQELKAEGLVGAIGIAAGPVSLMRRYVATGVFDVLLTHNRFTLVDRSATELIADAFSRRMGVFNAAPFGGGLLAHGSASAGTYAYQKSSPALLRWVGQVEGICAEYGVDLPTVALQFSLRNTQITSTVVGISAVSRLGQLERMCGVEVPESLWEQVEELGSPPSTVTD